MVHVCQVLSVPVQCRWLGWTAGPIVCMSYHMTLSGPSSHPSVYVCVCVEGVCEIGRKGEDVCVCACVQCEAGQSID